MDGKKSEDSATSLPGSTTPLASMTGTLSVFELSLNTDLSSFNADHFHIDLALALNLPRSRVVASSGGQRGGESGG